MKKWLVAIVCVLALCLAVCCAAADGNSTPILTVKNGTLTDGVYTGSFYYRLNINSSLSDDTSIQMGFGPVDADEPTEEPNVFKIGRLYGASGSRFTFSMPGEGENPADAIFVRLNDNDAWQKYAFRYDTSKTQGVTTTVTHTDAPAPGQKNYTVEWSAVSGADAFYIHWEAPNGKEYPAFISMGNTTSLSIGPDNEALVSRYGRNSLEGLADACGGYDVWIETLKGGEIGQSDRWHFGVSDTGPVLMLNEDSNDPQYVIQNADGSVSIHFHQWVQINAFAKGATEVNIYCLENPDESLTQNRIWTKCWPDSNEGVEEFQWCRNFLPENFGNKTSFDQYLVAEALYDDNPANNRLSEPMHIHVDVDRTIDGSITYTVPQDVNTKSGGKYQVAKDGVFYVDIDNNNNDADWYGLYITRDETQPADFDLGWVADSHWMNKSDGDTTRVQLTVQRCEAGKDYQVHVFAIKYGAAMGQAATTIPIHVKEREDTSCPVILSMRDNYTTGDRLMVYAHYTNPEDVGGWMNIRIYNVLWPDDVIYDQGGELNDYWNNDAAVWHSGTYQVEAQIFGPWNQPRVYQLKQITVSTANNAGDVADFDVNEVSALMAGEDLNIEIRPKNVTASRPAADSYFVQINQVNDGGFWAGEDTEPDRDGAARVRFDGGMFQGGGLYEVTIFGMKAGYDSVGYRFRFLAEDGRKWEGLHLTVNGNDSSDIYVKSSENLHIKVEADNRPAAIRILNGDHWEDWWGEDNYERDWGFGQDVILYAEATWDDWINYGELEGDDWEYRVNWQARSNTIVVHVSNEYGAMKAPTVTLTKDALTEGDDLAFTISDSAPTVADGARPFSETKADNWFFCNIFKEEYNEYGSWWERVNYDFDYDVHSGNNSLMICNLGEGTYQLEIGADAIGYAGQSTRKEFTISKASTPSGMSQFRVNGGTANISVQTMDEVELLAYDSDAEWYSVEIDKAGDNGWHDHRDDQRGGMLRDWWRSNEDGTYTLTAYAYRNDQRDGFVQNGNDGWKKTIGSTVTVTVTAPHNRLAAPQATLSTDWARVGDPITVTFRETANAEIYSYWITRDDDNEEHWRGGETRNDPGSLIIDTNGLEPGVFRVKLDVWARGYNEGHSELSFALIDRGDKQNPTGANDYYFRCDTQHEDYNEGHSVGTRENFLMTYFVPGATEVMLLDGNQEIENRDGMGILQWMRYDDIGEHQIYGKYKKGSSSWSGPVFLCKVKAFGQLDRPWVDMPDVVNAGESVSVTFHKTDNAQDYSFWMSYEGEDENLFGRYMTPADFTFDNNNTFEITVPSDALDENRAYHIYLDVINNNGYFQGHEDRTLYVIGNNTNDQDLSLNVPGETIQIGQTFGVQANAPGADDIFVSWDFTRQDNGRTENVGRDHSWEDRFSRPNYCWDGDNDPNGWVNGQRTTTFTAAARYGSILKVKRGTVTMKRSGEVFAAKPTLTIENTTVARNEYITATVGTVSDAYEYHVNIFDANGNWREDYTQSTPGTFLIPTSTLPEGNYSIGAYVHVVGKYRNSNEDRVTVTITACQNQFYVSKDRIEVGEPVAIGICAPGAERIRFDAGYGWDNEYGWVEDSWYNDNMKYEFNADEVDVVAEAMYNGEWREIGRRHISIIKHGDLAEPKIKINGSYDTNTVTEDQDLVITLDAVEHGTTYGLRVNRLSDGWNEWFEVNANNSGILTLTIPASELSEPNVGYVLTASVLGRGYDAGVSGKSFVTVPANLNEGRVITVEADRDNAQSNEENVSFTIRAEGATVVKLYYGEEWQWAPVNRMGEARLDVVFNVDGSQPVWATACYDQTYAGKTENELSNINWNNVSFEGMSNIVFIDVHSYGQTWMPDWVNVPNTVKWGEWLRVDIGDGGNAELLHIRIRSTDWQEEYWFQEERERGTYWLPTTMLTAGGEYIVTIDGNCPGFMWNGLDAFRFTVQTNEGVDPTQAYVAADKTEVLTYEPYHVMIHAPGAVQFRGVNHNDDNDENFILDGPDAKSGDCWWEHDQQNGQEVTQQQLDVYAIYDANTTWAQATLIGTLKFTVTDNQIPQTQILVDDVVDATEDITIEIPLVKHGYSYDLQIHETEMRNTQRYHQEKAYTANGTLTFTIPANTLRANTSHWIDCYISSNEPGYQMSDTSKNIMTVGSSARESNISLTLKGSWTVDSGVYQIPMHQDFEVSVKKTKSGTVPTAIALHMGDYTEYRFFDGEETVKLREYQPWPETIFARAYYGDMSQYDGRWDDVPWDELAWGAPTSTIQVNFYANGKVGEARISAPDRITRGETMFVHIDDVGDGANEAHANISRRSPDNGEEDLVYGGDWRGWDEARQEIQMDTWMLDPGEYWLAVDNSGVGRSGNRVWHRFEVYEELDKPDIIVNSTVDNTDMLTIAVRTVPNGRHYNVTIHKPNWDGFSKPLYEQYKNDEQAIYGWLFFAVPAETLEDGAYWIDCNVEAGGIGYYGNNRSRMILVRNNRADVDNKITINVDRTDVPINEPFRVNVTATGAKAIIIRCGDQSWGYKGSSAEDWITEYQPCIETLYAQAYYGNTAVPENTEGFDWESLEWGLTSEAVTIRFYTDGAAGQASFYAPESVERGQMLIVQNVYPGDGANAVFANICLTPPGDPEVMAYREWTSWDAVSHMIYLPTAELEPGTYWLEIDNSGVGRENSRAEHEFRITEATTQSGQISLTVPAKAQTGAAVPISIYAPGAKRIELTVDGTAGGAADNADNLDKLNDYRWDQTGEHTITARAKFTDNGAWVTVTKTVLVCDPLSVDLSGVPGTFTIGQAASFTIPKAANAEAMHIQVYEDWDGDRKLITEANASNDDVTIEIAAGYMNAGHRIQIDYQAHAIGFEDCIGGASFPIVPAVNSNATLTLAEGDINNIQTNQPVKFLVSPASGHTLTAVRFFDGHGYWEEVNHDNHPDWFEDEHRNAFFWTQYNHNDDPNTLLTVYAEIRLDGSETWASTNALRFTVKTPKGSVGNYDFTDRSTIYVSLGEPFEVSFTPSANATLYWADVFDDNDQNYNPEWVYNGNGNVTVSTQYLHEGEFYIYGRAVKDDEPGWRWTESNNFRRLVITRKEVPAQRTPTFVTPAALTEIEEEAFMGIAAKVVRISDNVKVIGKKAFAYSDVEQIIIPAGIEYISDDAFEGCGKITVFGEPGTSAEWWATRRCYPFYEAE